MVRSVATLAAVCAVAASLLEGFSVAQDPSALSCMQTVSPDDAARGLEIVSDPQCATGGDGCIDAICRHCRTPEATSADVATYPSCTDYFRVDIVSVDAVASDLMGSGSGEGEGDDKDASGSGGGADEDNEGDEGEGSGVLGDLPDQLKVDSKVSGTSYGCPFPTSGGDFIMGIQLVGDASCNRGGLGCFADVCRFCKYRDTPRSKHLLTCESLGYTIRAPVIVHDLPPPNPETGCPFNVSDGDFAVGIQLVGDASCANGGLGCYEDVCRFCKFQETPQSSHLLSCAGFGYPRTPAPTFAPVSLDDDDGEWDGSTGCAFAVSSGDFAVGVQLVGDASCASGGLGCFGTSCRFCQFRATPQSTHMLTCSSLGYPKPTAPIGTPQDVGLADPVTGCPFPVSSGDFAAGVQLVGDPTCAKGGLGCYQNVCRFCKFKETPQSKNWVPCADFGYPPVAPPVVQPADINDPAVDYGTDCPYPVSSGDYAAGIQLVGDATCTKGGLGCFKDVCRFCKFDETNQSAAFVPCASLGWPKTVVPVARPVELPTVDPATECPFPVSSGDFAAGIQLVGDATCVKGGLGCYKNVCRFCQLQETPQSKNWVQCSALGYPRNGATFNPSSIDANSDTGCPFPVSSGDFAAGIQLVGDGSCVQGGVGCYQKICRFCKFRASPQSDAYLNCEALGYFFGSDSAGLLPAPPSVGPSSNCPFTASPGDQAAGIQLVGDASCENGGIGCYQNVCRYCQFVPTEKSNQFVTCASLGYDYPIPPLPTMPAPTPEPTTPAPTTPEPMTPEPTATAPPPTAAPTTAPCPFAVSDGDFAAGVQLVGDPTCAQGGVGCYQNVCRYCKYKETPQSANWLPCSNFSLPAAAPLEVEDVAPTTAPPTPTPTLPTPTPTPAPVPVVAQMCDRTVSQGDKDVGVGLATDYSCLIAGLGCIKDTVCRFCMAFKTEKSNHLLPCSTYGGAAPAIEAPAPAAVDPTACSAKLAIGDTEAGVSAYYDATCSPSGGIGCVGGVCRFCQAFASDKSKDYLPCPTPAPTQTPAAPSAGATDPTATTTDPAATSSAPAAAAGDAPVAPPARLVVPLQAAAKESSVASRVDQLLADTTYRWTIVGAACVGVVAVVAVVALGAKRALARGTSRASTTADVDEATQPQQIDAQKQPTPTGVHHDQV